MSYADIQSRIADELDRSDLTSQIALEIKSAIAHYDVERTWFAEVRTSLTATSSVTFVAAPSDMVVEDLIQITVGGSLYELEKIPYEDWASFQTGTSQFGQPTAYAYYDDQFLLYPIPGQSYTLTISYIEVLDTLSAGSDTNGWLQFFEEMIRSRARAAIRINYLHEPDAKQEAAAFALRGDDCLSAQEYSARQKFYRWRAKRGGTGRVRAVYL